MKSKLPGSNELGCLAYAILVSGRSWAFQWSFCLERQTGGSKETKVHHLPFSCLWFFHIIINHSSGLEPRIGTLLASNPNVFLPSADPLESFL